MSDRFRKKVRNLSPTHIKVGLRSKFLKMKNIRTTIDNELEKLDLRWRNLPVRTQIRYVLFLFAFYLLMGVGVLIKVFYDLGRGDNIKISHIELPATIHHGSTVSDSIDNAKNYRNGRERE